MWSPHDLGMVGVNQLMLQAGRWGKVWRGGKVQVDCGERLLIKRARPYGERAPLIKGARPYGERAPYNKKGLAWWEVW
jgi:hypothetical protein